MPESWDGGVVYRSTSLTFVACRHALVFFLVLLSPYPALLLVYLSSLGHLKPTIC